MAYRLKSLELQGYKTFASRIVFEFPGRITAIVGPNGSGKSNIADAIRWVLGEQSFSLLRARKTEDMIFSGSEHRPRAGMALATIVFDNETQWLPLEFSEVSITRRAYRDGQNDYLLNGQRVRLKEITELLSRAGLSERTYTIIGQGLIDAALSLRPEDRRRFFEEAAGVGLYRLRRDEALNRLDATRRNLERVQDILTELEPRLKSLERQAQRAQEYERVQADLKLLLRDWYGFHWHQAQQRLVAARDALSKQEARLEEKRTSVEALEADLAKLDDAIKALRQRLEALNGQVADLEREMANYDRQIAVLDERRAALAAQQRELERDRERLQNERTDVIVQLATMERESEKVDAEIATAQREIEGVREGLQGRLAQEQQLKQKKNELQNQMSALEKRRMGLEVEIEAKRRQISDLQQQQYQVARTRDELMRTLQRNQSALEQHRRRREALEGMLRQQSQELADLTAALEATRMAAREAQREQDAVEAAILKARAELEGIEQAEAALEGLSQGTKALLSAANSGAIRARLRRLSHYFSVTAGYEQAIAAALGERIETLLLENREEVEAILAFLEEGDKGRAVLLLPVNDLPLEPFEEEEERAWGALGRAIDFVRAPDEVLPMLKRLLNGVWIVEHRRDAMRLFSLLPQGARLVTTKGEVFAKDGTIIAGVDKRAALISRVRRQQELKEMLRRLEEKQKAVQEHKVTLDKEVSRLESQKALSEREVRRTRQDLEQERRDFETLSGRIRRQTEELKSQEGLINRLQAQQKTLEEEQEKLQEALQGLQVEIEGLVHQIRELDAQIVALETAAVKERLEHWRSVLRMAEQKQDHVRQRIQDYQQSLQRIEGRLKEIEQREGQIQRAFMEIEQEHRSNQQARVACQQVIEALKSEMGPIEAEYAHHEQMRADANAQLRTLQAQLSLVERQVHQMRLDFAREQEALESLQRRIEEDLGLVSFAYLETVPGQEPLPLNGLVEQLPLVTQLPPGIEEGIARYRSQLRRIGSIHPDTLKEYQEIKARYEYLQEQMADLKEAEFDLRQVIAELDVLIKNAFLKTFHAVAKEFQHNFTRLFGGGEARLYLEDEENPGESGIEIEVKLPGRREQGLALLSGGERSLTSVALVFSLLRVSPPPFCVLDEVDAMLDEANVGRFCDLLKELSQETQFLIITHNRNTVQTADVIYGVTMGKDLTSQVISLRLENVAEVLV